MLWIYNNTTKCICFKYTLFNIFSSRNYSYNTKGVLNAKNINSLVSKYFMYVILFMDNCVN